MKTNKLLLISIIMLLLLIPIATATLSNLSIRPTASSCAVPIGANDRAQGFKTHDAGHTYIKAVYLWVESKTGSSASLNMVVAPDTGGKPDISNALGNITINDADISTTAYNKFPFTAGSYPQVTGGTQYWIDMSSAGGVNDYKSCYDSNTYENGTDGYASFANRLTPALWTVSTLDFKMIIEFSSDDGGTPAGNFSITAKDISGTSITNYSANINGTNYTTTSGTISTPILTASGNVNITIYDAIDSNGYFYNHTYLEIDTSSNWIATNLYQAEYTINSTELFTNNPILGTFHSPYNSTSGTLYLLSEGTNITFENTSYYNKTTEYTPSPLSNISFTMTGIYDLIITLKFNESCENCTPVYNTPILNGQINVTNTDVNNITTLSTATQPITYNGLQGNHSINATADIDGIGITKSNSTTVQINTTTYSYEPIIYPNLLTLTFRDFGGSLVNTNGSLMHLSLVNTTYSFETSSYYIVTKKLQTGQIKLIFGLSNGTNHTQYYEYNNQGQSISDTIYMLDNNEHSVWFKVTGYGGVPIEGATITYYQSERQLGNGTDSYLVGKRITDDDGKTFLFLDNNKGSYYTVSKSGYTMITDTKAFEDYGYTEDNPFVVTLQPTNSWSDGNLYIWTPYKIYNKSKTIYAYLSGRDYTSVIVNAGLRNQTITEGILPEYKITLRPNQDFDATTNDNISMAIWLDGTYWQNYTIIYDTHNKTKLFADTILPTGKTLGWILFIILLVSIIGFQMGFEQHNIGSTIFQYGLILITFIYPPFIYASMMIILAKVMQLVKKVYSE